MGCRGCAGRGRLWDDGPGGKLGADKIEVDGIKLAIGGRAIALKVDDVFVFNCCTAFYLD